MDKEKWTVPELTGCNYFIWALKMKAALSLKRLDNVLTEIKPEGIEQKESEKWDQKNADAVAYIKLSLSDQQALQFASEENAKLLWEKIKSTFTGMAEDRKIDAGNELKNLELNPGESVSDYVARARGLETKCLSLELKVSPRELVYYTVRGLKGKYSRIREILKTQREKTMDEILEILREEEATLNLQNGRRGEGTNPEVFLSRGERRNSRLCYICRRPGHIAKNCFYRNKNTRNDVAGNKYRKNKHQQANCSQQNSTSALQTDLCDRDQCDKLWILDSGASSHMTKDEYWFKELTPEISDILLAGKESKLICNGLGTVNAKTIPVKNVKPISLIISNVHYVPDLRNNLLSVSALMDKGCHIESDNDGIIIFDNNGKFITRAIKNNNRFEIYLQPICKNFKECCVTNSNFATYELWHNRLCHLNPNYMIKMKDYIDFNNVTKLNCETCDISKITRKNHPSIDISQSSEILELVHADLCGPVQVESLGRSKYFMILVDDFSGMYFTYFLRCKNEVYEMFPKFKERYENLTGKRIKRLRTDNGLEFVNQEFDNYLANNGIFHEKTIRYNSESNGKAERANRVLLERARALLYDSELPLKFWAEAINCSTQVSNLTPRKGKEKIPLEIWTGKKPKLNYLKKFGCVAYFHVPKMLRNKFDVPGKRGIMLGYARERRGYRIFDIKSNKIIEERSVKFNESLKGSAYLGNKQTEPWDIEALSDTSGSNKLNHQKINLKVVDFEEVFADSNTSVELEAESGSEGSTSSPRRSCFDLLGPGILEPSSTQQESENNDRMYKEEGISQIRRSERLKAKQLIANVALDIPNNYSEAMKREDSQNWELAMQNELNSLNKHKVWEIVEMPKNEKIVKSKWIFTLKEGEAGDIKYKARLVAAGFNQIKNKDYAESYSPVVNIESFRLLIALSAKLNLIVKMFDVKTAYLHSPLEETVFMTPPSGYEKIVGAGKVCKLNKSIYGLPQSGRNWYIKIKSELEKIGLKQLASDNCVFTKNNDKDFFALCIYVDDIAIFCNNDAMCEEIVSKIRKVFELHEIKNSKFLGIELNRHENGISLSQANYIESLLCKHNMENCKTVKTPIVKGEDKSFPPTNDVIDLKVYQEIIGELLYLASRTRPDISFVTTYLSQFNHNPEKRHFSLAKRVLRYLKGTKDYVLFYSDDFGILNASADASWGNAENGKSFSGGIIMLGNSLISWKCNKQKSVSLSTCEAELFSISEICKDIMWIRNLLTELKCERFVKSSVLYSDSQAAIQWLKGTRSSNKSRHMNIRFNFVKELLMDNIIKTEYIQSESILADFLTKAVCEDKLLYSLKSISLIP